MTLPMMVYGVVLALLAGGLAPFFPSLVPAGASEALGGRRRRF